MFIMSGNKTKLRDCEKNLEIKYIETTFSVKMTYVLMRSFYQLILFNTSDIGKAYNVIEKYLAKYREVYLSIFTVT